MHAKYQCSIINTSEDMSQVKVFVTNRRTDRRMSFNVPRFRERRGQLHEILSRSNMVVRSYGPDRDLTMCALCDRLDIPGEWSVYFLRHYIYDGAPIKRRKIHTTHMSVFIRNNKLQGYSIYMYMYLCSFSSRLLAIAIFIKD